MKQEQFLFIAAAAFLAYALLKGQGRRVVTDVIPLDEPSAVQWADAESAAIVFQ